MPSPLTITIDGLDVAVTAAPLDGDAFALFGQVAQNPRPGLDVGETSARGLLLDPGAVFANQGSAIKYPDVSHMLNFYDQAPSRQPGVAAVSMFVCAARQLEVGPGPEEGTFGVTILERHPYTSQTFVPLTAPPQRRYLVLVAPSLAPSPADEVFPVPASPLLPGRGLPDLGRLRAFVATSEQAVTYAPGTWHAPMVALGAPKTTVDFIVVQFANKVAIEDCQEVVLSSSPANPGSVVARVPSGPPLAKL